MTTPQSKQEAVRLANEVAKALLASRGCDVPKDDDFETVQFGKIALADAQAVLTALHQAGYEITPIVKRGEG